MKIQIVGLVMLTRRFKSLTDPNAKRVGCKIVRAGRTLAGATDGSSQVNQQQTTRKRDLPLSPAYRAKQSVDLKKRLAPFVPGQLDLAVTDNSTVMITVRRQPRHRRYAVRIHHLFADAPNPVIHALGRYVALEDPEASATLNDFIEEREDRIKPTSANATRRVAIKTAGSVYNLQDMFDRINRRYFAGKLKASITWGRKNAPGKARQTVRLGSYCFEGKLIRIHPGLDKAWVPQFYLEWVCFHEMLHAVHEAKPINGRKHYHTPAFRADEQRFEHYAQAVGWERRSLPALLRI